MWPLGTECGVGRGLLLSGSGALSRRRSMSSMFRQTKLRIRCDRRKCILRPVGRMPMLIRRGLTLRHSINVGRRLVFSPLL